MRKRTALGANKFCLVFDMAERKGAVTYESIMRDLVSRNYSPVYVLMGDESYFIDKISDYIEKNVLQPDEVFFNQIVMFGTDVSVAQVMDQCKGYPVMPAQHRVVIVKEAQGLRMLDQLEKYMERPASSTILVICYKNGSIDKRKKIIGKAEAVGVVFESKKKRDMELPGFIDAYLRMHKATIDSKSAALIAEHIGSDLNRLTSELDKVLISLPDDDRRVTPEIVEHQIGISKEFNSIELRRAIVEHDVFKANQIVNYFDKNPKAGSLYSFLPMLFNYFQNLMVAHYTPNHSNDNAVAEALELKSAWAAKDYMVGMRTYSPMKTLQIISKIREIDAKSKGLDNQNTSAGDLVKELIFFILH